MRLAKSTLLLLILFVLHTLLPLSTPYSMKEKERLSNLEQEIEGLHGGVDLKAR